MGGLLDSIKGMFINEEGGIKWSSIIGIAAGAAVGGLLLPELIGGMVGYEILAAVGGGIAGLMVGNAVGGMGGEASAPVVPVTGPAVKAPAAGPQPKMEGPGALPQGKPPVNPRAVGGR